MAEQQVTEHRTVLRSDWLVMGRRSANEVVTQPPAPPYIFSARVHDIFGQGQRLGVTRASPEASGPEGSRAVTGPARRTRSGRPGGASLWPGGAEGATRRGFFIKPSPPSSIPSIPRLRSVFCWAPDLRISDGATGDTARSHSRVAAAAREWG